MRQNFDHIATAIRQVGVIITGTGFITGIFYSDQWLLTLYTGAIGLALIWLTSLEN